MQQILNGCSSENLTPLIELVALTLWRDNSTYLHQIGELQSEMMEQLVHPGVRVHMILKQLPEMARDEGAFLKYKNALVAELVSALRCMQQQSGNVYLYEFTLDFGKDKFCELFQGAVS